MYKTLAPALLVAAVLVLAPAPPVQSQMAQRSLRNEVVASSAQGNAVAAESGNVAVFASNTTSGAKAYLGARCCAGDFYGEVYVHGSLRVDGRKNFVIDHPTDPANKYLVHASIESDEMKNLYDGVATLDAAGAATVQLPGWFGALNRDVRYQLTPIGAPAPGLHVAREIAGNRFTIAGGAPGSKVSWQVSGVRQDGWARSNPMAVEPPKHGDERGRYLHPEAFGQPPSRSLERVRHPR